MMSCPKRKGSVMGWTVPQLRHLLLFARENKPQISWPEDVCKIEAYATLDRPCEPWTASFAVAFQLANPRYWEQVLYSAERHFADNNALPRDPAWDNPQGISLIALPRRQRYEPSTAQASQSVPSDGIPTVGEQVGVDAPTRDAASTRTRVVSGAAETREQAFGLSQTKRLRIEHPQRESSPGPRELTDEDKDGSSPLRKKTKQNRLI